MPSFTASPQARDSLSPLEVVTGPRSFERQAIETGAKTLFNRLSIDYLFVETQHPWVAKCVNATAAAYGYSVGEARGDNANRLLTRLSRGGLAQHVRAVAGGQVGVGGSSYPPLAKESNARIGMVPFWLKP